MYRTAMLYGAKPNIKKSKSKKSKLPPKVSDVPNVDAFLNANYPGISWTATEIELFKYINYTQGDLNEVTK